MATDKGFVAPPVSRLRKIMKPVISTDVMGNRNVEVRAVGARAEPAVYFTNSMIPEYSEAVRAAGIEEERIRVLQEQKAARLKQFQEDVRRRVKHINKTKRKQQIEDECLSMEKHLDQVKSSLRAAERLTERKDCVVSQQAPGASQRVPGGVLHDSAAPSEANRLMGDLEEHQERRKKVFEKHNQQVHTYTTEARQKLSRRKVERHDTDRLPVGKWFTLETYGKPARLDGEPLEDSFDDDEENVEKSDDDDDDNDEKVRSEVIRECWKNKGLGTTQSQAQDHIKYFSLPPGSESKGDEGSDEENKERDDGSDQEKLQRVQFNLGTGRKKGGRKKGRPSTAPHMPTGASEHEERRRLELQKLNYRRLYSNLERQAVRDHQRRKKQHSQIQKIKKEKEELRRQEEEQAQRLVEPRDPVTGETSVEIDLRQQLERSHLQERLQEREEQQQKRREMMRYLDALRSNLREKLSKQGLELPALCCCGEMLFDTHPETCANNCFYYKNHRAYARALQSLLASSEVM
ncbi:hypothetical protein ACOMHN_013286 [Nucella lapillus]